MVAGKREESLGLNKPSDSQKVREHEILRLSANISGENSKQAAEQARHEVLRWVQKRSAGSLPDEAWKFQGFEHFSGGRNSIGIRLEEENFDIWALRADDPDDNVAGRVWTTEVVVGIADGQAPTFTTRLLVSTNEDALEIEPHTPGLVQQVVEQSGLVQAGYKLRAEAWHIETEDEARNLVYMLVNEHRAKPIFVLTISEGESEPLIDAARLVRATLGTAFVVVLPASLTWVLTDYLDKKRSVYNGAVRVYMPGFSFDSDPYAHRLFLGEYLETSDGRVKCLRWLRLLAARESVIRTPLGRDVIPFAELRNADLQLTQRRLAKEGASDSDKLQAANKLNETLKNQLKEQKAETEGYFEEWKTAEERAQIAEVQQRAANFRIQQLLDKVKDRSPKEEIEAPLPDRWSDFVEWCDANFVGQLTLSPLARRNVRSPKFNDVALAARCIQWLATECRDRRMAGGEGSLREEMVEDGIRNSPCGGDEFEIDWQGQKYAVDWHVKNGGNTRDPQRCLRIYYFWDQDGQQIVVVDMPGHRRTSAS